MLGQGLRCGMRSRKATFSSLDWTPFMESLKAGMERRRAASAERACLATGEVRTAEAGAASPARRARDSAAAARRAAQGVAGPPSLRPAPQATRRPRGVPAGDWKRMAPAEGRETQVLVIGGFPTDTGTECAVRGRGKSSGKGAGTTLGSVPIWDLDVGRWAEYQGLGGYWAQSDLREARGTPGDRPPGWTSRQNMRVAGSPFPARDEQSPSVTTAPRPFQSASKTSVPVILSSVSPVVKERFSSPA